MCSNIMVSVSLLVGAPVDSSACSSAVRSARLSEPTISQLVPSPAAGRPG
jgi:hypothetical protein